MRTPSNEPIINASERREKQIPDRKRVSKLDRQQLQRLQRLHTKTLPRAKQALREAEESALQAGDDAGRQELVNEAQMLVKEIRKETENGKALEQRMRESYNHWARNHNGWDEAARKLGIKHDICLRKLGEHGADSREKGR